MKKHTVFTVAVLAAILGFVGRPARAAQTIAETVKFDVALPPKALNNTNVTGAYFSASPDSRFLFRLSGGAAAITKTTVLEVLAASDTAGTGAAVVGTTTATANVLATEMTLTLATTLDLTTTTVNGLLFTADATVTSAGLRQYSISGDDTADAAAFVTVLNDATYGVPGLVASSSAGVITLRASPLGTRAVTASADLATITAATVSAQAYVEVSAYDFVAAKPYLAAKVTTTANTVICVDLLRTGGRRNPTNWVAGSN